MATNRHQKTRTRQLSRMAAAAAVLAVLVLAGLGLRFISDPFPKLEIDGFRITREEYLRAMYQARNDVLSDHAAAGISLKDWSSETALGDPRRLTMDRTLEILREYYAVSSLAVERGYLADAGYDAMMADMERINSQRQEALDSGAIVTGIPTFTAADYISYRASGIRLQFCTDSANPEYQVTEQEILLRYEADRDNLYRKPDSMELAFLTANGADDALARKFELLRQQALTAGSLSEALTQYPELNEYFQEISVNSETYSIYSRSHGDVLACADDLQGGEISRVFRQEDWLCLVQCLEKTVHQYVPLEEVESIVVQSIREDRYDALIARRTEDAAVRGDLDRLYRFTAEQLP